MGKFELIRLWWIIDFFVLGLVLVLLYFVVVNIVLSKSGVIINFFILCFCILLLSNGFNVVGIDGVGKVVIKVIVGVINYFGDLFVR